MKNKADERIIEKFMPSCLPPFSDVCYASSK